MFFRRCCGCKKRPKDPIGGFFIAIGIGLMLAYIIPYYLLIVMLGIGLIAAGIYFIRNK